tara:strand:- start:16 stop:1092 length:1077 start_codon:yes stop_codon:yes gene_type:complete
MTDPLVQIEGISKSFDKTVVLQPMDLTIARGEFVTLLGPSGCGKSTTLRILGGFEIPDQGRILLEGEDVTKQPPERRHVNMVFQDYALFPHMTVKQNMAFGLELKGMRKTEIQARLEELMSFLDLLPLADRYPSQLSGGQRQRVALARALAPDPALLLLDEPLGALDAKLRHQVQLELKSIQRRTNKTFLFVTHDQEEALTMSDRIIVMKAGHIEQDGSPEDLYFRPITRFVAEFVGETNLLEGEVLGSNEYGNIVFNWYGQQLLGRAGETIGAGKAAASLRLESLNFHHDDPGTPNALRGQIIDRVFLGSRSAVVVQLDAVPGRYLRAFTEVALISKFGNSPVWIDWQPEALSILKT